MDASLSMLIVMAVVVVLAGFAKNVIGLGFPATAGLGRGAVAPCFFRRIGLWSATFGGGRGVPVARCSRVADGRWTYRCSES